MAQLVKVMVFKSLNWQVFLQVSLKKHKKRLKILEKQQLQQPINVVQNDLFAESEVFEAEIEMVEKFIEIEKSSPALEALAEIDVDDLTPREALAKLYALKELLKQG